VKSVSCQCGQQFAVGTGPFPKKISCYVCGNKFTVLDSGEKIETSGSNPNVKPMPIKSSGIQEDTGNLPTETSTIRFGTAKNTSSFTTSSEDSSAALGIDMMDLAWKAERAQYAVIDMFGILIVPTRRLSVIIFVSSLVGWFAIASLLRRLEVEVKWNYLLFIVNIFGMIIGTWMYPRGKRYERAEQDFRSKRLAAIKKSD
jgi:hypothetical protein